MLLHSPCEWIACGAKGGPSWSWLMQLFHLACHLFSWEMGPSCAVRAWKAKIPPPVWGARAALATSVGQGGVALVSRCLLNMHGAITELGAAKKPFPIRRYHTGTGPHTARLGPPRFIQAAIQRRGTGCVHTTFSTVRPWSLLTTNKNKNNNSNNNLLLDCKETSISGGRKKNVHWLHLQIPLPYD